MDLKIMIGDLRHGIDMYSTIKTSQIIMLYLSDCMQNQLFFHLRKPINSFESRQCTVVTDILALFQH